jgi:glycosyl transferase family 25
MNTDKIKTYCISLKRATERREKSKQECQKLGLPFEFITAIDGKTLTNNEIIETGYNEVLAKKLRNKYQSRGLSHTDIAIALSHLKVYKKIIENQTPIALILEDDAVFNFDKKYLNKILTELPNDWEICLLFHGGLCKKFSGHIYKFKVPPGFLVCYLLTLKGAEKLLKLSRPLRLCSDTLTGRAIYKNILNGYGVLPIKVKHDDKGHSFNCSTGDNKKILLKKLYDFAANRFAWVRRLKYLIRKDPNDYFSELY